VRNSYLEQSNVHLWFGTSDVTFLVRCDAFVHTCANFDTFWCIHICWILWASSSYWAMWSSLRARSCFSTGRQAVGRPAKVWWVALRLRKDMLLGTILWGWIPPGYKPWRSLMNKRTLCRSLLAIVVVRLRAQHVIYLCSQISNAKRSQLLLRTLCRHLSWRLTKQLIERPNFSNFLRIRRDSERETSFECFILFEGFLRDCFILASQRKRMDQDSKSHSHRILQCNKALNSRASCNKASCNKESHIKATSVDRSPSPVFLVRLN
jgi:hypothetical protein